jgi:hypothetical protein
MIRLKGCGDEIRWMRIIFFSRRFRLMDKMEQRSVNQKKRVAGFLGFFKNSSGIHFFNEQLE